MADRLDELKLIGGSHCLDFANSVDPRHSPTRFEFISDYGALVEWARLADIVDPEQAMRLLASARRQPREGRRIHERAIALREAIYELFCRRAHDSTAEGHLATVNSELNQSRQRVLIADAGGALRRDWAASDELDQVLWPIAESAADLLTSPTLRRVRECEGDRCGWLFLDTSKAGRRRWCSMADCGTRAKASRRRQAVLDAGRLRKSRTSSRS